MAVTGAMIAAASITSILMGVTVVVISMISKFTPWALLYHALVFGAFFGLYQALPGGFKNNFNMPTVKGDAKYKGDGPLDVAYYTMVVHTSTGFGDVFPLTWLARSLVILHMFLVFLHVASLLPLTMAARSTA